MARKQQQHPDLGVTADDLEFLADAAEKYPPHFAFAWGVADDGVPIIGTVAVIAKKPGIY